jgi:hypothetical protein
MHTERKAPASCLKGAHSAPVRTLMPVFLGVLLLATGCNWFGQKSSSTSKTQTSEVTPKPAATREVATAPAAPAAPDETARRAAIDWATRQDQIMKDPNGQWAVEATASSTYNDAKGVESWAANQTAGPPNVEKYGDDGHAWAPKNENGGLEWLDLTYVKPVHATEVRVRESYGTGAVIKIELQGQKGAWHTVWTGTDTTKGLDYLIAKFPRTDYQATHVKVTLATNLIPGWNEIDAVQLVGTEQ